MLLLCLALILVAFAVSLPLTWLLIGAGRRLGQIDAPDAPGSGGRKTHARAVPNTGGVAIFAAVALPMIVAIATVWAVPPQRWDALGPALAPLSQHAEGLRRHTPMAAGVLMALAVVHVLGLIDDRKRLKAMPKLAVQLAVAIALATFFDIRILEFLGRWWGLPGLLASIALSVVWIAVVTNAMNFLDNMDGLSGGVGAICAALYLAATLVNGQWFVAAVAALLLGALLGFLVFNFPPARVFMGDGGSLVLGLLLAVISVRTVYFLPPGSAQDLPIRAPGEWYGLLMPLMVLAIPLYDFTSVTLIRLGQGKSPFVGDQQHFSHRLVRKGLSRRTAVIVIWLCALATGLSGVMLGSLTGWQAALAAGQTAAVIAVLALLERTHVPGEEKINVTP